MTQPEQVPNRRKYERRPLRVRAQLSVGSGEVLEVRTTNICANGLGIVAPVNPKEGSTFTLTCSIPVKPKGAAALNCQVRVIHSVLSSEENGFKVGLQFSDPSPQLLASVSQYLA